MSSFNSIAIVGAGNVAFHLGKALVNAGARVDYIWNRTPEKARELAGELQTRSTERLEDLANCDLIICCLSDSALAEWVPKLSQLAPTTVTAGTIDVLTMEHQFPVGVFYPLQSFSKNAKVDFNQVPLFVEGSDALFSARLMTLAGELSLTTAELSAEKRIPLHLAAVFINNFTNHMVALGQEVLDKNGLPFDWMKPLLQQTIAKLDSQTAHDAQTGPARRHDDPTIQKHLSLLDSETAKLYEQLTKSIQQRFPR